MPLLVWHGETEEIPDFPAVEAAVRANLARELSDLEEPQYLLFHQVLLTEDRNGASVEVWSRQGSPAFHCRYEEATLWRPLGGETEP